MDFLHTLGLWGGSAAFTIAAFLIVLTIVVFVHEMGHFLVGRWCGVRVESFSIGFGPELFGWCDRHGTRWKISAIPLGGYVKFFGDADAASRPDFEASAALTADERRQSFFHKSVGQRAAVVAAGPIANFLLAIVVFAGLFMAIGKAIVLPRVHHVMEGSAAAEAGFRPGDLVRAIDGQKIESFGDMQRIVAMSALTPLSIEIARDGQVMSLTATPKLREDTDMFGSRLRLGVLGISRPTSAEDVTYRRYAPPQALWMGVSETWSVIVHTGTFLRDLVNGKQTAEQIGGPVKIARASGYMASMGIGPLLGLVALLSVSIGLFNLLPIPVLDGGHLFFYAIEAIKGSPVSEKAQDYSFRLGFALIMMLMVFATWNDLKGPLGHILNSGS